MNIIILYNHMSKYGHTITPICFDPQHSPEEYRKPVFYSYLDKPQVDSPPYSLPSANKELDSQVVNLEPKMSSVEIHCYDEEICIIVSGDNLWFSRDAQVLKWSVCTTLSKNTNLQFQALVTGQQIQPTELPQVVTIRLGTCFSQYVMEKSVAVTVKVSNLHSRQYCRIFQVMHLIIFCIKSQTCLVADICRVSNTYIQYIGTELEIRSCLPSAIF